MVPGDEDPFYLQAEERDEANFGGLRATTNNNSTLVAGDKLRASGRDRGRSRSDSGGVGYIDVPKSPTSPNVVLHIRDDDDNN